MKHLLALIVLLVAIGFLTTVVGSYGDRLTTGQPSVASEPQPVLSNFGLAWVQWFDVVLRDPSSVRYRIVTKFDDASFTAAGKRYAGPGRLITYTAANGFGGRSKPERAYCVIVGGVPWYAAGNDGPFGTLPMWRIALEDQ